MHVIPVIDIKGGVAVAARGGNRAAYPPIETPLAAGADPLAVARGFQALFPFRTFYIADLDGIEGRGAGLDLVRELATALPDATLWVDNGAADAAGLAALLAIERVCAVVGSETGIGAAELRELAAPFADRAVLSLDFRGDTFLGEPELLRAIDAWPDRVIAMTLAQVGSNCGPDRMRLGEIVAAACGRRVYAAGGIRNSADLAALRAVGAAGALVATALHTGQIKTGDLEEIAGSEVF